MIIGLLQNRSFLINFLDLLDDMPYVLIQYTLALKMSGTGGLFMKWNAYVLEGGNKGGLPLLKVEMCLFQLFYYLKLKTSKFKVLAFWSQWSFHNQIYLVSYSCYKDQICIKKLVGVVTLPPLFLPSGTKAFYFINRPPGPNILTASVLTTWSNFLLCFQLYESHYLFYD